METKLNQTDDQLSFLDDIDLSDCDGIKSEPSSGNLPDLKPHQEQELFNFFEREIDDMTSQIFPAAADDKMKDALTMSCPTTSTAFKIKHEPEVFSDCMWSADARNGHRTKDRKRDVSITLSECANGLATITSMEMFDILGKTPPVDGLENSSLLWNPLNDASETESDNEDEEIDVVTSNDDDVKPWLKQEQTNFQQIEPGNGFFKNDDDNKFLTFFNDLRKIREP